MKRQSAGIGAYLGSFAAVIVLAAGSGAWGQTLTHAWSQGVG